MACCCCSPRSMKQAIKDNGLLVDAIQNIVKQELKQNMSIKDKSIIKMNGKATTQLFGHNFMIEIKNKPKLKQKRISNWKCTVKHIDSSLELYYDGYKSPQEAGKYGMKNMLQELAKNKTLFTWKFVTCLLYELKKKENGNWTLCKIIRKILNQLMVNHMYQTLLLFIFIILMIILTILYPYYELSDYSITLNMTL